MINNYKIHIKGTGCCGPWIPRITNENLFDFDVTMDRKLRNRYDFQRHAGMSTYQHTYTPRDLEPYLNLRAPYVNTNKRKHVGNFIHNN